MNKTTISAIILLVFITLLVTIKENKSSSTESILKESSVILAFGDSLTYGFGVPHEFSYPKQIEKKINAKIINAGVNGELSAEGLNRLPLYLKNKPDIVILCHGGNDLINKLPAHKLKANLLTMIKLIKESGAHILFVGVPDFGIFGFDVHEVYGEVAKETGVLYEDEILTEIQKDRSLKNDYVHPNEEGYEKMADAFIDILK